MSPAPKLPRLLTELAAGKIVPMSAAAWADLAARFDVVETIATGMAGDIVLLRLPPPNKGKSKVRGWALVEQPSPSERVIRPLADEKTARALIADRLAAYERMWDG